MVWQAMFVTNYIDGTCMEVSLSGARRSSACSESLGSVHQYLVSGTAWMTGDSLMLPASTLYHGLLWVCCSSGTVGCYYVTVLKYLHSSSQPELSSGVKVH